MTRPVHNTTFIPKTVVVGMVNAHRSVLPGIVVTNDGVGIEVVG